MALDIANGSCIGPVRRDDQLNRFSQRFECFKQHRVVRLFGATGDENRNRMVDPFRYAAVHDCQSLQNTVMVRVSGNRDPLGGNTELN